MEASKNTQDAPYTTRPVLIFLHSLYKAKRNSMTLFNAVLKGQLWKAPDKGQADTAICGLLAGEACAEGTVGKTGTGDPD